MNSVSNRERKFFEGQERNGSFVWCQIRNSLYILTLLVMSLHVVHKKKKLQYDFKHHDHLYKHHYQTTKRINTYLYINASTNHRI